MGATAAMRGEHHGGTGGLHNLPYYVPNLGIRLRTQLPLQGSTGLEQHYISAIASFGGGERNGQPQHDVKLSLQLPHMLHSNSSCSLRSSITAAAAVSSVEVAVVVTPMSTACGYHTPATMAAMNRHRCLLIAVAAASCRTFIINA